MLDLGQPTKPCTLRLQDGPIFRGTSFGYPTTASGEVVFNTGMIGYPETLTDPSYHGQLLVLTYPLIGNYGVPASDTDADHLSRFESDKIQVAGLIVSQHIDTYSHWNAAKSLATWLHEHHIPAITGVDTRELTKRLRKKGTMLGTLSANGANHRFTDPTKHNLAADVSITTPITYTRGKKTIILVDCGVKNNIIRAFLQRNFTVKRVPWNYDFATEHPDGIVLSNGPGDPKKCTDTITHVQEALDHNTPILGICLGSQILALAAGAQTYKLKYGHRSHNQPCVEAGTKRCYITSQNHGYAVDATTLPEDWREWFYNNNDHTNEGIHHISRPFYGAQFHPEASPGPDDTEFLFDMFVRAMR
jgi:carbamoyl-phosphate synthase small subunit